MKANSKYNLKHYAYIGDAVWELFIRKAVIDKTTVQSKMHTLSTKYVCADYQSDLLLKIEQYLKDDEIEIKKRARNIKMTINKKNNPKIHSLATAFEAIVGYLYLNDENRLEEIFDIIKAEIEI